MRFNPNSVLIDDVNAVAGQLTWILYEVLEDIEPYKAAEIASDFGSVISQSYNFIIDERRGAECLQAICNALDEMSQPGEYFGFPRESDNVLGWFQDARSLAG